MLFICSISYVLFNVLTAQKMKFSQFPQETEYLVTFTEEILNGKLHFLCSVYLFYLENVIFKKDSFLLFTNVLFKMLEF